jgi:hypothetical protein
VDDKKVVHSDGKHILGADDGAGIALLLRMIDNKIPGSYIFHLREEIGGTCAKGMAMHHSDFLVKFDRAITFDRRRNCSAQVSVRAPLSPPCRTTIRWKVFHGRKSMIWANSALPVFMAVSEPKPGVLREPHFRIQIGAPPSLENPCYSWLTAIHPSI